MDALALLNVLALIVPSYNNDIQYSLILLQVFPDCRLSATIDIASNIVTVTDKNNHSMRSCPSTSSCLSNRSPTSPTCAL